MRDSGHTNFSAARSFLPPLLKAHADCPVVPLHYHRCPTGQPRGGSEELQGNPGGDSRQLQQGLGQGEEWPRFSHVGAAASVLLLPLLSMGAGLKGLGAQVVFSSILPVSGYGLRRDRRIYVVNQRLQHWCRQEGFGFHDHSPLFGERGSELLGRDGLHLSPLGRRLFSARLADLLHRALN